MNSEFREMEVKSFREQKRLTHRWRAEVDARVGYTCGGEFRRAKMDRNKCAAIRPEKFGREPNGKQCV